MSNFVVFPPNNEGEPKIRTASAGSAVSSVHTTAETVVLSSHCRTEIEALSVLSARPESLKLIRGLRLLSDSGFSRQKFPVQHLFSSHGPRCTAHATHYEHSRARSQPSRLRVPRRLATRHRSSLEFSRHTIKRSPTLRATGSRSSSSWTSSGTPTKSTPPRSRSSKLRLGQTIQRRDGMPTTAKVSLAIIPRRSLRPRRHFLLASRCVESRREPAGAPSNPALFTASLPCAG